MTRMMLAGLGLALFSIFMIPVRFVRSIAIGFVGASPHRTIYDAMIAAAGVGKGPINRRAFA